MTDESKTQKMDKPKIESLELNRETVADLTEREAEQVQGGLRGAAGDVCTNGFTGCVPSVDKC